jgi:hypothetical protein
MLSQRDHSGKARSRKVAGVETVLNFGYVSRGMEPKKEDPRLPCVSRLRTTGRTALRRKAREGRRGEVPNSDLGSVDPQLNLPPLSTGSE